MRLRFTIFTALAAIALVVAFILGAATAEPSPGRDPGAPSALTGGGAALRTGLNTTALNAGVYATVVGTGKPVS